MSQAMLDTAVLDALRAETALAPLLAELSAAARHGNLDRLAQAARAAQAKGDMLTAALSQVFSRAGELSAAQFDAGPFPSDDRRCNLGPAATLTP